MHTSKRMTIAYLAMAAALLALFALNLFWGSVALSPADIAAALLGRGTNALAANILLQLRLPRAVMVVLLGAALSVAGYLLQTFFANPIAGPFVMGISSGAKLAVALTMVVFLNRGLLTGSLTLILAAFAGAMAAMLFVLAVARRVQQMSILVICGVMIGYICTALTDFIVTFADDSNIVNLHNWSLGSFSGMSWENVRTMVLACGASPIMADDAAEVEDITSLCAGLNLNIGTLNSRTIPSMLLAGHTANRLGRPVVLDPVGAGASHLRTDTAFRLLREVQFTVIRGNISEIKTLASGAGTTKGVDADVADKVTEENLDSAVAFAKAFAARTGAVVAITGAIDIVADAQKAYCIRNGNAMMSSITGTGCQLSALTAAFVTANPGHPLEAAAAAVCAMGLAGEVAHQRLTPQDGNTTYRNYIIDAIYNMTPEQLEKGANYEVR